MEVAEKKRFPKCERLRLKKDIDQLFNNGRSFIAYPLKIIYLPELEGDPSDAGMAVFISVPKKRIKGAVQRNSLKRIIRETYRLNKPAYFQKRKSLRLALMYISNEIVSYKIMEKAIQKTFKIINQSQTE